MKLSLDWIFDHINADWKQLDIPELVARFNQTVAEIESFHPVRFELDQLSFAQVVSIDAERVVLNSSEWKQELSLPLREGIQKDKWYLVAKVDLAYRWATMRDFGAGRDDLLPALCCDENYYAGDWKVTFGQHYAFDYILEIDNKSITHRPDMWGHRGFAREIAAMLDFPLKPLEIFLADMDADIVCQEYAKQSVTDADQPFCITIQDPDVCSRFAGMFIKSVTPSPSPLRMAAYLARLDSRPIDALVDITNYVMLDLGHPMHAFDADTFEDRSIVVRRARNKEKLTVLDGDELELTSHDIVVANGKKPAALGGVIGGLNTGIGPQTRSLFLEAACFDAATIRRTATRYKKRTEASARFEKSLDATQPPYVLLRALDLLVCYGITQTIPKQFVVVGPKIDPVIIDVPHSFIERRLGATVAASFIIKTLEKLAFTIEHYTEADGPAYRITVPTFRATKDVQIKEDIVEEVGRFFDYGSIEYELPSLKLKPSNMHAFNRVRTIKHLLASSLSMRESENYAFYDESFLRTIDWQPRNAVGVANPVSENWQRMVTSLLPHLFKAVEQNVADYDHLRFFEWARVWQKKTKISEHKVLAGIMFQKQSLDFYDAKAELTKLFDALSLDVHWDKVEEPSQSWFAPYQTANIMQDGDHIGIAGMVNQSFLNKIGQGHAFAFELDGDFLLQYQAPIKRLLSLPKYPEVVRDISMLIPLPLTVDELTTIIAHTDERVVAVTLIDFFEKDEWKDQKALTFRFVLRDPAKTMRKEEVDAVWEKAADALKQVGATIR